MTDAATTTRVARGNLLRSSRTMALGTLTSRFTGFLRTVVIADAIGLTVGDAYNVANTIPNILYDLLLGGVLASVVVPLLVQAAVRDADQGEAYAQRLITLVLAVLSVTSAVAVILAPQIVGLYASRLQPEQRDLAITFARFFLPQVLIYGLGAILGAILNTRGSFAPPMWTPVLNNLVVIGTGVIFVAISSTAPIPGQLSSAQTLVLAVGTTAGIVAQTVALLPALRRVGFRLRLRTDLRGAGLRSAGPFAGWMLGYVITNQVGYAVVVNLATAAGAAQGASGSAYSPYTYAYVLFTLPHGVIAVSMITALFPEMSRSAATAQRHRIATDLAVGLKLAAVMLVPAAAAFLAFGPLIATVIFGHGHITVPDARLIGATLAGFALGLVPFSAFQLQLRAWLAIGDARTPTLVNLAATAVNVIADVGLYLLLPPQHRVIGLAVGFSVSYAVGAVLLAVLLRRRIGRDPREHLVRTLVRLTVAVVPATALGYLLARLIGAVLGVGPAAALIALLTASTLTGLLYVVTALRLRVGEVREVMGLVRRGAGATR